MPMNHRCWARARLLVLVAAMLPGTAATRTASAEAEAVRLEVVPKSVVLPARGAAQALVVVRNSTSQTIRNVRLSYFTDVGVKIAFIGRAGTITGRAMPLPVLKGELGWRIRISRIDRGARSGIVQFRVDYQVGAPGGGQALVRGVQLGALEVQAQPSTAVGSLVDLVVSTAGTSISQQRPQVIYLLITSKASFPITVAKVRPMLPPDLHPSFPRRPTDPSTCRSNDVGRFCPITLRPREARAVEVKVETGDAVRPGRQVLVFAVGFSWKEGGAEQTATMLRSKEVDVGVFGESKVLQTLGLPSVFILPGFLFIAMLALLWRLTKPAERAFPLEIGTSPGDPVFWLAAVTLSALIGFLYWLVTRRNLLDAYGLTDVATLWVASIVSAGLVWLVTALGVIGWAWHVQRHTPTVDDEALDVLKKMGRERKQKAWVERVEIEGDPSPPYLLVPRERKGEQVWIGPNILLTWLDLSWRRRAALERMLGERDRRMKDLAELLSRGVEVTAVRLRWNEDMAPGRPKPLSKSEVKKVFPEPDQIVVEDSALQD
jgi:hypothetical protein